MQLKDVIHYYIGKQIQFTDGSVDRLVGIDMDNLYFFNNGSGGTWPFLQMDIKPILRPITSLTDDEKVKWYDLWPYGHLGAGEGKITVVNDWISEQNLHMTPAETHYLLSIGIDLWNLIETSQAIDKTQVI